MKDIEKNIIKEANNSSFEFKEEYWESALIKLQKSERQNIVKKFFWVLGLLMLIAGGSYITYQGINSAVNKNPLETSVVLAETNPTLTRSKSRTKTVNSSSSGFTSETVSTLPTNRLKEGLNPSNNIPNASQEYSTTGLSILPPDKKRNSIPKSLNSNSLFTQPNSKVVLPALSPTVKFSDEATADKKHNSDIDYFSSRNNENTPNSSQNSSTPDLALNTDQESAQNTESGIDSTNTSKPQDSLSEETGKQLDSTQNKPASQITQNKFKGKISFQAFVGGIAGGKMDGSKGTLFNFPYAGLEIGYSLTPSLSISSGLGYYQRKMNPLALSVTLNEFRFGLNQYQAKISLDQSTWLEVPIKFNYKIREGHYLSAGASASFLLTAKNSISTDLVFSNENAQLENSISEEYKKYRGFYNNSYSLQGSYQVYYKKIGIGVSYHYGLNDLVKDDIIQVTGVNRNSRFSLTLKYSIH